jgi:hypothetical protein
VPGSPPCGEPARDLAAGQVQQTRASSDRTNGVFVIQGVGPRTEGERELFQAAQLCSTWVAPARAQTAADRAALHVQLLSSDRALRPAETAVSLSPGSTSPLGVTLDLGEVVACRRDASGHPVDSNVCSVRPHAAQLSRRGRPHVAT